MIFMKLHKNSRSRGIIVFLLQGTFTYIGFSHCLLCSVVRNWACCDVTATTIYCAVLILILAGALNMQSFRHHHHFCFFVFCLPRCVQTRGSGGGDAELLAMLQCWQWGCTRIDFFVGLCCESQVSSYLQASKSLSAWNILLMWTSKRRPPPPCLIAKTIFPNYKRSMKEGENEWLNT